MLPDPTIDSPDAGVAAAHPHPEFGAARVALALADFSPDDMDAFACVADSCRDVDVDDIQADVARLAVKLAALPPLTRWAATVVDRYWTQPEGTRLAFVVHFSWSHYPGQAVDEIVRVVAAFDWKKPPATPLPDGAHGAYRAIVAIMNMTGAGKARARQFIEVMEAAAPRPPSAGDAADDRSEGDESQASSPPATALAVVESGSGIGGALDDQDFAALVAPGAMETAPDHRFAGLAVFAAGTAAAGGAAAVAGASGAGGAAAAGAAAVAAAAVVSGGAVARRRFRRRSASTEPAIEAIGASASTATEEGAAALPATEHATTDEPATEPDTTDEPATEPDTTDEPDTEPDTTDEPDTEPEDLLAAVSA